MGDQTTGNKLLSSDLTEEYGIFFIADSDFMLAKKRFTLRKEEDVLKIINHETNQTSNITIGSKKNFLILSLGIYTMFFVNGKLVKQIKNQTIATSDITITGNLKKTLIAQSPTPEITFMDGLFRPIQYQYQYVNSDNHIKGKISNAIVYNGWGNPIIHTKPVLSVNNEFSFDNDFVTYNYQQNTVTGTLSDFYQNNSDKTYVINNHNDYNKMFHKTEYSNDILQRVKSRHKPNVGNSSENSTRITYQGLKGTLLEKSIGIAEENKLNFTTTNISKREHESITITDVFGRPIGSKSGESISGLVYEYSSNKNKVNHKLPLSYQLSNDNQYVNIKETKDLLGLQTSTFSIDEGSNYTIKNKKGLLVFEALGNFTPEGSDKSWKYIKYDLLNRPIESGIAKVTGMFDFKKMNLLANIPIWSSDVQTTPIKYWSYDTLDKNVSNTKGRLTQVINKNNETNSITNYSYNEQGQIISVVSKAGSDLLYIVDYEYYTGGKLKRIVYPNRKKVAYSYDINGRIYGVGKITKPFEYAKYVYGINNKVIQKKSNDISIITTKEYTVQDHLKNTVITVDKNEEQKQLYKEIFQFEENNTKYYDGLIIEKSEIDEDLRNTNWKYVYDNQYQITEVQKTESGNTERYRYTYDVNGNLKSYTDSQETNLSKDYNYRVGSNKLDSTTENIDDIGQYTTIGKTLLGNDTRLEYDELNNKVSKIYDTETSKQLTFAYDGQNNRVQKIIKTTVEQSGTLNYVWGTGSLPMYESFESEKKDNPEQNNWDKIYIYGIGYTPVAMIHKENTYYFIRDYQNNLRYVINAKTSKVEEKYSYAPYGRLTYSQQNDTPQTLGTYLYTGQEYDKEIGLYNFKARLYSPDKRIFLQPDPKHNNYSPYTFVDNNPINYIDLDGEIPTNVDFTGSLDLFPVTGNQKNTVKIVLTGSRNSDFSRAFKKAHLKKKDTKGYTWHHVHDFDVNSGESTMQLVKSEAHKARVPHKGSVGQFVDHFGVKYDTHEAKVKAYDKGWIPKKPRKNLNKKIIKNKKTYALRSIIKKITP